MSTAVDVPTLPQQRRPLLARLRRTRPAADPAVARLAALGLLRGVPSSVLAGLAPHVEHLDRAAGARLLTEGAEASGAFLLLDGIAESSLRGHRLGDAQGGELLGDLALLRSGRSTLTWDAVTDVRVLVVPPDALRDLLRRCAVVADRLHGLAEVPVDGPACA